MSDLPAPLSPPDCDLRGYDFMPLHGHRLFHSDLYEESTPEEFKIAVKLWWEAWNQCPAGSLPSNDAKLRRLADLGHDTKTWERVKRAAMRGFVLCNDDRFYHRWLCEWAKDAFAARLAERDRKRRYRERQRRDGDGDDGGSPGHRDGDSNGKGRGHTTKETGQTHTRDVPNQPSPSRSDADRDGDNRIRTGEERRGEKGEKEKQEKSSLSFSETYPAREARADASRPMPKLVWPDDPDPEPTTEPQRRFDTRGHPLESTAKREPYGPVRTPEEQIAILRGEKSA